MNGVPPPVDKMDKEEKHSVLMKFTKANFKLNIPLEISQIDVTFKDWKGLR